MQQMEQSGEQWRDWQRERQMERGEVKKRDKKKKKTMQTPLTFELFRRTMSLMTIDRSSSFSWERKKKQV